MVAAQRAATTLRDPCFTRSLPIQFSETDFNPRTKIDFKREIDFERIPKQGTRRAMHRDEVRQKRELVEARASCWPPRRRRLVGLAILAASVGKVKNFFVLFFRLEPTPGSSSGGSLGGGGLYSEPMACQVRNLLFSIAGGPFSRAPSAGDAFLASGLGLSNAIRQGHAFFLFPLIF